MRRRKFITLLGGTTAAWPLTARAQQPERVRRIGVLMGHSERDAEFQDYLAAFRDALRTLGWIEGRNIKIDSRWGALSDPESRRQSANELLALSPDVIVTQDTPPTGCVKTQKIRNATRMTFFNLISKSNVLSNWMPETVLDE
jgi:putative tryptophan/tyrosine transport system substrate-binding protein